MKHHQPKIWTGRESYIEKIRIIYRREKLLQARLMRHYWINVLFDHDNAMIFLHECDYNLFIVQSVKIHNLEKILFQLFNLPQLAETYQ